MRTLRGAWPEIRVIPVLLWNDAALAVGSGLALRAAHRDLALYAGALLGLCGAAAFTQPATAAPARPQVVLVTSDCTTTNFLCPPFERTLRRTGIRGQIISPDGREDPVGTLSLLAERGPALVIVDPSYGSELALVARRFPKIHFALFDAPRTLIPRLPPNVQAVLHLPGEAAYLAGWLAARLEQRRHGRDVIAAVGGAQIPSVVDFITGFRAGARRADPAIEVLVGYSQDFADPDKCEAIAKNLIARGAGTVFNVAGGCGLGALEAAGAAGVWGIGVDTDQSSLGPHILTSVVKRYDAGFERLLAQVESRRWRTGTATLVLTLSNGGAELGRISPRVPKALRRELDRVRQRIVDGEIRVRHAPAS
jgi:basic membrane protein A and related proteins